MLSRDDILIVYAAGPDAVVQVIEVWQTGQTELRQQVAILTARVAELEARLNQDNHNSHKPPASDGLGKSRRALAASGGAAGKRAAANRGIPG